MNSGLIAIVLLYSVTIYIIYKYFEWKSGIAHNNCMACREALKVINKHYSNKLLKRKRKN